MFCLIIVTNYQLLEAVFTTFLLTVWWQVGCLEVSSAKYHAVWIYVCQKYLKIYLLADVYIMYDLLKMRNISRVNMFLN